MYIWPESCYFTFNPPTQRLTDDLWSSSFFFFFFLWKSGVVCLSSGVAPLLHPALPRCSFFLPLSDLERPALSEQDVCAQNALKKADGRTEQRGTKRLTHEVDSASEDRETM